MSCVHIHTHTYAKPGKSPDITASPLELIACAIAADTGKPYRASSTAGLNRSAHGNTPNLFQAISRPRSSPGTPIANPPNRRKKANHSLLGSLKFTTDHYRIPKHFVLYR